MVQQSAGIDKMLPLKEMPDHLEKRLKIAVDEKSLKTEADAGDEQIKQLLLDFPEAKRSVDLELRPG
jgi:hypothetical protein